MDGQGVCQVRSTSMPPAVATQFLTVVSGMLCRVGTVLAMDMLVRFAQHQMQASLLQSCNSVACLARWDALECSPLQQHPDCCCQCCKEQLTRSIARVGLGVPDSMLGPTASPDALAVVFVWIWCPT